MRIEKWGFLLSYAIYLGFCIIFSLISKDVEIVGTMIFAITIASTFFAISDTIFTKLDIDKRERELLSSLYQLTQYAEKIYMTKIEQKYGPAINNNIEELKEIFNNDEEEIEKIFSKTLSKEEKENYLNKIKEEASQELISFVKKIFESDMEEIIEESEEIEENRERVSEIFLKVRKKEKVHYVIASCIAVMGLAALLIILTMRIKAIEYINNALTVLAFFSVIINLILKEYYKASSLKKFAQEKKELVKDLREGMHGEIIEKIN